MEAKYTIQKKKQFVTLILQKSYRPDVTVVAKPGTEWNGMKNTFYEYEKSGME